MAGAKYFADGFAVDTQGLTNLHLGSAGMPAPELSTKSVTFRVTRASLIVSRPFGRWCDAFGDNVVAAAMIDRRVHHAEASALRSDLHGTKDRDPGKEFEHQGSIFNGLNFRQIEGGSRL
jgi:hypothetical protein